MSLSPPKLYAALQFGERVAMNSPIQGTAADVMKIAMIAGGQQTQESAA
ncbi:MAG: DNA polymerase [Enterocloster sp.]